MKGLDSLKGRRPGLLTLRVVDKSVVHSHPVVVCRVQNKPTIGLARPRRVGGGRKHIY